MAHTIYSNFYLSNEVEDTYKSHLDLQPFCTIDNNLVGTPGMIRKINRYTATDATQKLAMGAGNTQSIEVSYTQKEYTILLAQNRFQYFDEQAMTDPMLVPVGTRQMGIDLFNTVTADIYNEFNEATLAVAATSYGFDMFADAVALMNIEGTDNDPAQIAPMAFAFASPKAIAKIRKNCKEELKYVEAFVRTGYVGTLAGVNIYAKKNAADNTIIVATNKAVTLFNKKGVEIEQQREPNTRQNSIYSRKYYSAARTYATKAVKITVTETP